MRQLDRNLLTELVGVVLRKLPPFKGKGRLGRTLVPSSRRGNPIIIDDKFGSKIWAPNLLDPIAFDLWLNGEYDPEVYHFLRTKSRRGTTILDVGANIGVFTVPLAKELAPDTKLLSVEASPSLASVLLQNVTANALQNVTVVNCAASNGKNSEMNFFEAPASHFGMGSMAPQFGSEPIRVPAKSLDTLLRDFDVREVSAIKVDVEGFEADVFEGAEKLLTTQFPSILFEFADWAEERALSGGVGRSQEILLGYGYTLWKLADYLEGKKPLKTPLRQGFENIVALKTN
jgi:FkbM family methyltransferase